MERHFLRISALFGASAVLIGAFAAHGLKPRISPEALTTFETGVKYHFYHTFALLAVYFMTKQAQTTQYNKAFYCFVTGIILFSGSLYFLATREIHGINLGALGILTPIGGVFFIVGWLMLGFSFSKE